MDCRNRVARHIRKEKRLHWHIDYLLQVATVVDVWCQVGPERLECAWAEALEGRGRWNAWSEDLGPRIAECWGHLFYSAARPGPLRPDARSVTGRQGRWEHRTARMSMLYGANGSDVLAGAAVGRAAMMASTDEGSISLGSGLPVLRIKGAPGPDCVELLAHGAGESRPRRCVRAAPRNPGCRRDNVAAQRRGARRPPSRSIPCAAARRRSHPAAGPPPGPGSSRCRQGSRGSARSPRHAPPGRCYSGRAGRNGRKRAGEMMSHDAQLSAI